ncbi:MAG: hypothetical protein CL608_16155 [Anaerolineaceae bacterium]|nr:hypothetical protein [Anaerolineaceae bacterium]
MTKHVIQFGQLEEFMTEPFVPDQVVRVVVLEISEGVSAPIPDLRQVSVGVHVRTINSDGHVLACYLPVATVQLYNGRRGGDPTWQKYAAAWEQAAALKERVITTLQAAAAEKGFKMCAAGVIDLGEIRPLQATWIADLSKSER